MKMTIGSITKVHPDKLQKLYELLDDIGANLDYSEARGQLSVYAKDIGIVFEADEAIMKDRYADAYWADDAERVAEGYWRE
jgi:hypothetical protein